MTPLPIAVSVPTPAASRRAQANAVQQNAGLPGAAPAEESSFHDALVQMLGKGLGKAFSAAGDTTVTSSKADGSAKTGAEKTDPLLDASTLPDAQALPLPPVLASAQLPASVRVTAAAAAEPALDASALPLPRRLATATAAPVLDASALSLPRGLTSALAPAAATAAPVLDASALPLPQALASVLVPAAAAMEPALDASALPLPQSLASALMPAAAAAGSALIPVAARQPGLSTVVASSKASPGQQTFADTALALDASTLPAGLAAPNLVPKAAPANALSAVRSEPLHKEVLATPAFDTASFRTEPPVASPIAAQATDIGSSTPTRGVPEPSAVVQTRVGERGWDQAVGDKLVWMVNQKHQVAQLHLNPPDLGPLKIAISLDQNQASAQFFSAHASVREALEVAMPRLREMLADSGITLGNTSVGAEAFREPTQQQPRAQVVQTGTVVADSGPVSSGERLLRPMLGLVDTFA